MMSKTKFDTKFDAEPAAIPSHQHPALQKATASGLQIRHGFFTAKGGVSTGIYESLNCGFGSQDDRATNYRKPATGCQLASGLNQTRCLGSSRPIRQIAYSSTL